MLNLLLEDDTMIASGLVYALNNEGYEVIHCQDVQSALEQIKHRYFDLPFWICSCQMGLDLM